MSRSRVRERERIRAAIHTTDPAALVAYVNTLRPVVTSLRMLVEDATAEPSKRIHARSFLRRELLRGIRELEARINAAAPAP
ncbi:hypothetical protein [Polyangium sp. 15x6]|uniref:hypothetical protein n=1 Tax=Polyangium sp. 15x6 TaxID=3042687 RepID=UPI00249ABBF6|nr:hypothetical protein [Polyangium sp. 15x6]MDI3291023.1 hypothetical protein [Polyangium sp. 15x6]